MATESGDVDKRSGTLPGQGLATYSAFNAPSEDWPLYALIKILVYEQLARLPAQSKKSAGAVQVTAKRLHQLVWQPGREGNSPALAELFGLSAHFLRNRLRSLNHGTVLTARGGRVRRALSYGWNESINEYTFQSFCNAKKVASGPVSYVHDAYLIDAAFGTASWTEEQYTTMMRGLRDAVLQRQRFHLLSMGSSSTDFTKVLKARLGALERMGLIERTPTGRRLTPRGEEASYWYELFLFSAPYQSASPAVPDHSPVAGPAR